MAQGNPGKRRLNEHEPRPPRGELDPPKLLELTPLALQVWAQLAPIAAAMKTLTTADLFTFGRYCEYVARWIVLKRFLNTADAAGGVYTIRDAKGRILSVQPLPQAIEYRRLPEILVKLEDHFGLTAAARSRIHVEHVQPPAAAADPAVNAEDTRRRDWFKFPRPA